MQKRKISDEQLVAFCDDQCGDQERRLIESAVANDSELKQRLEKIAKISAKNLQDALDIELEQAPLKRLEKFLGNQVSAQNTSASKPYARLAIAACLVATLFVGMIGGGLAIWKTQSDHKVENWRESVAVYQMLYTKETLANISIDEMTLKEMRQRLRKLSGLKIEFFDLEKFGLTFKRGQILEFEGNRLVQLAYLSKSGQPVAICFLAQNQNEMALKTEFRHGLNVVHWVKNGKPAMVIGDIPVQTLKNIVTKILKS